MPRKVTLQIKNEGLELLKKHSIRETTRIINTRYAMDLSPSTILRWDYIAYNGKGPPRGLSTIIATNPSNGMLKFVNLYTAS